MNDIRVRSAGLDDLPAVAALDREVFGAHASPGTYPFFVLRQLLDLSPDAFLVAERHGRVAGYVIGALASDACTGWVMSLAVGRADRRLGLGRRLLEDVLSRLVDVGARRTRLVVEPENSGARRLYLACGFRDDRVEPDYFGPGHDRSSMVRD